MYRFYSYMVLIYIHISDSLLFMCGIDSCLGLLLMYGIILINAVCWLTEGDPTLVLPPPNIHTTHILIANWSSSLLHLRVPFTVWLAFFAGVTMPNPVQRSACDRCHGQKLHCSRSGHGGPCIRCTKVKSVCTWTPSTCRQSEKLNSKPPNLQESSIATLGSSPMYDDGNGIESMTPLITSFPTLQTEFDFSALSTCPMPDNPATATWSCPTVIDLVSGFSSTCALSNASPMAIPTCNRGMPQALGSVDSTRSGLCCLQNSNHLQLMELCELARVLLGPNLKKHKICDSLLFVDSWISMLKCLYFLPRYLIPDIYITTS